MPVSPTHYAADAYAADAASVAADGCRFACILPSYGADHFARASFRYDASPPPCQLFFAAARYADACCARRYAADDAYAMPPAMVAASLMMPLRV